MYNSNKKIELTQKIYLKNLKKIISLKKKKFPAKIFY